MTDKDLLVALHNFLRELPNDLGRGHLNGLRAQLMRKIALALLSPEERDQVVGQDASVPGDGTLGDPIRALVQRHADELAKNEYAYFELAYTRKTGWMAWITDKPLCGPVVNPDRHVLASGQGGSPEEACTAALADDVSARAGSRSADHNAIQWAEGPFAEGARARIDGFGRQHVPSEEAIGAFARRSWLAGWADADKGILADGLADSMPVRK